MTSPSELLLNKDNHRFVMFPIRAHDIWDMYKHAVASFWVVEEVEPGLLDGGNRLQLVVAAREAALIERERASREKAAGVSPTFLSAAPCHVPKPSGSPYGPAGLEARDTAGSKACATS